MTWPLVPVPGTDPGMIVEAWHDQMMDLWLVPPLTWQASVLIHGRRLSLYSKPILTGETSPSEVGGGGRAGLPARGLRRTR